MRTDIYVAFNHKKPAEERLAVIEEHLKEVHEKLEKRFNVKHAKLMHELKNYRDHMAEADANLEWLKKSLGGVGERAQYGLYVKEQRHILMKKIIQSLEEAKKITKNIEEDTAKERKTIKKTLDKAVKKKKKKKKR